MIKIQVDRTRCNGHGNCMLAAETIFDVDDDGLVVLKQESVTDDQLKVLRRAVYDCPTQSISFVTDAEPSASES